MKKILLIAFLMLSVNVVYAKPSIEIEYNNGIYHIILSGNKIKKRINFVASDSLMTNKEVHKQTRSVLTINAGYFDPENGKTISYVVTDRNTSVDPILNENLLKNPILNKNLNKILNRTEFRVVECNNKYSYQIVPHKNSVDFGCNIITSAQGGPMILPELRLEEELFIVKDKDGNIIRESASVLQKTARTVMGIKDGDAHILIITNENPMDIYEVRDLCKQLGFERAMTFDGGSSTSLNYKNSIDVTSNDGSGRLLKSFMIITK